MKLHEITRIDELVAKHVSPYKDGAFVLAHRGKYWVINDDDAISKSLANEIETETGIDLDSHDNPNVSRLIYRAEVAAGRRDLIRGRIKNDVLVLADTKNLQAPQSSSMIKKLVYDLGLSGVKVEGTLPNSYNKGDQNYNKNELVGDLPNWFYHGTSSNQFEAIMKTGIRSNQSHNWSEFGVKHTSLIFGTIKFSEALFHASRTATKYNSNSEVESFPVIIKTAIPDKNKLIPDYDIWKMTTNGNVKDRYGYGDGYDNDMATHHPEGKLWKAAGIYGYQGRIPSSNFIEIYTWFWDGRKSMDTVRIVKPSEWETVYQTEYNKRYR